MPLRYKEVKELIFNDIVEMEPNTRIPSRSQLCKKYMVTRTTVDRSISELIGEGHLYSVNGSGTFVADLGEQVEVKRDVLNIGVLLPNIMHDTYPGILRGIEDTVQKHGMNVIICNTDHNSEKQFSYIKRLINSKVGGIIIVPAVSNDQHINIYSLLCEAGIPFVFCNRSEGGADSPLVCSNDFYGGYLATNQLIESGYQRIAYIEGVHYRVSVDRCQGYLAALWEHNIPVDENLIRSYLNAKTSTRETGEELMNQLLDEITDLDGVFCFNDQMALGAMSAIIKHRKRVSDDIGVIGYDNTKVCEMIPVKLSSVAFRNYEIGQSAAEIILKMIEHPGEPVNKLTSFCPQLVVRESCVGKHR